MSTAVLRTKIKLHLSDQSIDEHDKCVFTFGVVFYWFFWKSGIFIFGIQSGQQSGAIEALFQYFISTNENQGDYKENELWLIYVNNFIMVINLTEVREKENAKEPHYKRSGAVQA